MPRRIGLPGRLAEILPQMQRLSRTLTGNRDEAQDLVQEVLVRLWARLRTGEKIENLRGYAMTALRNQYRQSLRQRVVGVELEDAALTEEGKGIAALALQELEAAIDRLPETQAHLLRLVADGETSPRALARRTGLPVGTVMSRLARARAQLRKDLQLTRGHESALLCGED